MLRFLHIPKTAGATFTQILEEQYPTNRFHFIGNPKNDIPRYHQLPPEEQASLKLVTGHAPAITGIDRVDSMPTVCFFREPVPHVQSFCQHVSEGKTANLLERFPPATFNLDDFLWKDINGTTNWQTRLILGNKDYAPRIRQNHKEAARKAFDLIIARSIQIGLTEAFDESLGRYTKTFGWTLNGYQKKNVKDTARLLPWEPRHIARIEEINQADIELYRLVSEQFRKG